MWERLKAGEKSVESFTREIWRKNAQVQVLVKLLILVDQRAREHRVPERGRNRGRLTGLGHPSEGQVLKGGRWLPEPGA